jgi:Na+/H+ antiporter NhaD/arsenite permease-like protein
MDPIVLAIFGLVYFGMLLGEIPWLALDRAGVALLGTIALIVTGRISPESAWDGVDVPTIMLLFGLMVVSAQLRLSGFYAALVHRLAAVEASPERLLALLVAAAGGLSAVLANDIVCLAMAPVLVEACARRGLNPTPFLLALACAANVGSAATLIGNPQNMVIGQALHLSFTAYLRMAGPPVLLGLVAVWWVVRRQTRKAWRKLIPIPKVATVPFDAWQTGKGLIVLSLLVLAFFATHWPRDVLALTAAGILLMSRSMASRDLLGYVDGQLLVLFVGLFAVNHVFAASGMLDGLTRALEGAGVHLAQPPWLFAVTVLFSNLVSNVPAVMLLLPVATHPLDGHVLALASTLAGNLFIAGSIANVIVVEQAAQLNVRITWKEHARVGVPVTLLTLAFAAGWLWLNSG